RGNGEGRRKSQGRLLTFRGPHELGRRCATINVGALFQPERLRACLRQSLRAQFDDLVEFQGLSQFLALASPADANETHAGRVVLELLGVRPFRVAGLGDHHDVVVATTGNAGLLADLVYPAAVRPVERRWRVSLRVAGCAGPRFGLYHNASPPTPRAHQEAPAAANLLFTF